MLSRLKSLFFSREATAKLSRPQIALLSQFNRARSLKASGWIEGWQAVLNETPQKTMEQFVKTGLIIAASREDYADALNISQLKAILKKTGLPVSGKKSILVERVVSSGYDVVRDYSHGKLWKCSAAGLLYTTPSLVR